MERIEAPFNQEQVAQLNRNQQSGYTHPFTCGREPRLGHSDGEGILVARKEGWMCPDDDYTQSWAHAFMAEPISAPNIFRASSAGKEGAVAQLAQQFEALKVITAAYIGSESYPHDQECDPDSQLDTNCDCGNLLRTLQQNAIGCQLESLTKLIASLQQE